MDSAILVPLLVTGVLALAAAVLRSSRPREVGATFIVAVPAVALATVNWRGAEGFGLFHSIDVSPMPAGGGKP